MMFGSYCLVDAALLATKGVDAPCAMALRYDGQVTSVDGVVHLFTTPFDYDDEVDKLFGRDGKKMVALTPHEFRTVRPVSWADDAEPFLYADRRDQMQWWPTIEI